jgi:hypothetical protein
MSHSLTEEITYTVLHNRCPFTEKKQPVTTPVKTTFLKRPSTSLHWRNSLIAQVECILPFWSLKISYNKCAGPYLQNLHFINKHYPVFTLSAWTLHFCASVLQFEYPRSWGHYIPLQSEDKITHWHRSYPRRMESSAISLSKPLNLISTLQLLESALSYSRLALLHSHWQPFSLNYICHAYAKSDPRATYP